MSKVDQDTMHVLHFQLHETHMCADLLYIEKVLPLMFLEPVPGSAPYIVGLLNLAGKAIPAIDLSWYLGSPSNEPYALNMVVLICHHPGTNFKTGLLVNQCLGVSTVNLSEINRQDQYSQQDARFVGTVEHEKRLSLMINMKNFLEKMSREANANAK